MSRNWISSTRRKKPLGVPENYRDYLRVHVKFMLLVPEYLPGKAFSISRLDFKQANPGKIIRLLISNRAGLKIPFSFELAEIKDMLKQNLGQKLRYDFRSSGVRPGAHRCPFQERVA